MGYCTDNRTSLRFIPSSLPPSFQREKENRITQRVQTVWLIQTTGRRRYPWDRRAPAQVAVVGRRVEKTTKHYDRTKARPKRFSRLRQDAWE